MTRPKAGNMPARRPIPDAAFDEPTAASLVAELEAQTRALSQANRELADREARQYVVRHLPRGDQIVAQGHRHRLFRVQGGHTIRFGMGHAGGKQRALHVRQLREAIDGPSRIKTPGNGVHEVEPVCIGDPRCEADVAA